MSNKILVSIIIRTFNEERYIAECLNAIMSQNFDDKFEIIVVDSGSSDNTLEILKEFPTRVIKIKKKDFTFGRSLNIGCENATGEILVFLSAHCIPVGTNWLKDLVLPLKYEAGYTYSRQVGRLGVSKHSEVNIFRKYFPPEKLRDQLPFFCNNASAACNKKLWCKLKFNEDLSGLEDLEMARRALKLGEVITYVPSSSVEHIHHENSIQTRNRYRREAIALQSIIPNKSLNIRYGLYFFWNSIVVDICTVSRFSFSELLGIFKFRYNQFMGSTLHFRNFDKIDAEISNYYDPRY